MSELRLIGHQWSRRTHEIKDYLARYQVPYRWIEVERAGSDELPESAKDGSDLPLLLFSDGTRLANPEERELAEKLGLVSREASPFYDLVIVGGGPAGLAAAVYASSEGLRTVVVEGETPGGQAGKSAQIENYLGFPEGLTGGELARRAVEQAKGFDAEILAAHAATALEAADPYRQVTLEDGTELRGYAVLISTGVSYRALEVPGAERLTGKGVYYGAATAEARLCRDRDACVVGGGNSAGQAAMLLARYARTVHVLTTEASLETSMSLYLAERIQAAENIEVHPHTTIGEVHGNDHMERVTLMREDGEEVGELEPAAVYVFIGATPRTDWLDDVLTRDEEGFLRTGDDVEEEAWPLERSPYPMETCLPGVFAAGDVRSGSVKRVVAAAGEGAMAIHFVHRYLAER